MKPSSKVREVGKFKIAPNKGDFDIFIPDYIFVEPPQGI